jgi:hypothetical protein
MELTGWEDETGRVAIWSLKRPNQPNLALKQFARIFRDLATLGTGVMFHKLHEIATLFE